MPSTTDNYPGTQITNTNDAATGTIYIVEDEQPENTPPVLKVDGSPLKFIRHSVIGDGDCGYSAFGITRSEAHRLLGTRIIEIRDLLRPIVEEQLIQRTFINWLKANGRSTMALDQAFEDYRKLEGKIDANVMGRLLRHAGNLTLVQAYIDYDVEYKKVDHGWADPRVLQALAHLQNLRLRIWECLPGNPDVLVPHHVYHLYGDEGTPFTDLLFVNGNHFDHLEAFIPPPLQQSQEAKTNDSLKEQEHDPDAFQMPNNPEPERAYGRNERLLEVFIEEERTKLEEIFEQLLQPKPLSDNDLRDLTKKINNHQQTIINDGRQVGTTSRLGGFYSITNAAYTNLLKSIALVMEIRTGALANRPFNYYLNEISKLNAAFKSQTFHSLWRSWLSNIEKQYTAKLENVCGYEAEKIRKYVMQLPSLQRKELINLGMTLRNKEIWINNYAAIARDKNSQDFRATMSLFSNLARSIEIMVAVTQRKSTAMQIRAFQSEVYQLRSAQTFIQSEVQRQWVLWLDNITRILATELHDKPIPFQSKTDALDELFNKSGNDGSPDSADKRQAVKNLFDIWGQLSVLYVGLETSRNMVISDIDKKLKAVKALLETAAMELPSKGKFSEKLKAYYEHNQALIDIVLDTITRIKEAIAEFNVNREAHRKKLEQLSKKETANDIEILRKQRDELVKSTNASFKEQSEKLQKLISNSKNSSEFKALVIVINGVMQYFSNQVSVIVPQKLSVISETNQGLQDINTKVRACLQKSYKEVLPAPSLRDIWLSQAVSYINLLNKCYNDINQQLEKLEENAIQTLQKQGNIISAQATGIFQEIQNSKSQVEKICVIISKLNQILASADHAELTQTIQRELPLMIRALKQFEKVDKQDKNLTKLIEFLQLGDGFFKTKDNPMTRGAFFTTRQRAQEDISVRPAATSSSSSSQYQSLPPEATGNGVGQGSHGTESSTDYSSEDHETDNSQGYSNR